MSSSFLILGGIEKGQSNSFEGIFFATKTCKEYKKLFRSFMFSKTGVTSSNWDSAKSVVINLFVNADPREGGWELFEIFPFSSTLKNSFSMALLLT